MFRLKQLIHEVHRRSLWQVLGIYLAGSWIALQVVETLTESMELPGWVQPFAFVLLVIGFPIVVATAFVQEGVGSLGREPKAGTSSDDAEPASTSPDSQSEATTGSASPEGLARLLTWRNAILGGVSAFALWGVIATVLLVTGLGPGSVAGSGDERVSIAVLPFSSVGTDEESRVFSLGIHDDLLTKLSKIGSLRVISRTSVMEYEGAERNIRKIGNELGVSHILEGSVLTAGGQVNINAQLIDAETDDHLWAETYNRSLSVAGIFAIQRELAQKISASLSAALLPDEVAEIEAPPTENLEAYNLFLRGHTYFHDGPRSQDFMLAIEMYEKAVELDPEFALAYARLSLALGMRYEIRRNPDFKERALAAASKAFSLDPDLAEAHLAFGQYYYSGERDLGLAMEHLTRSGQGNLHNADLFHLLGAVQRRMGDLEGSIASWQELVRLDPLSAHFYDDLGSVYANAASFDEAETALRQSIQLSPRSSVPYGWLSELHMARGDLESAQAVLDEAPEGVSEFRGLRSELDLLARDFDSFGERNRNGLNGAMALDFQGESSAAGVQLDSIRPRFEEWTAENPDAWFPHAALGYMYAALGRSEDAIREADEAIELMSVSTDHLEGPNPIWWKVLTLGRLAAVDEALDALEELVQVSLPGEYTPAYIRLHPGVDPLREDPRFEEILGQG
jgi:TolB-like protein/Flp pilus assembly protein TadD